MIPVAEAEARIRSAFTALPATWVPLEAAFGRVLAGDLAALRDQPAAAVSAMDGYAVRAAELAEGRLVELVGSIAAGSPRPAPLAPGTAARIFTGGLVPDGADAVLIQENAALEGARVGSDEPPKAGQFVRPKSLDFRAGTILLSAGTLLTARRVGLAAAMGHGHVLVRRRPRVGVAATGDELRRPGAPIDEHQLPNSNVLTIMGMVRAFGGEPLDLGIVPDEPGAFADLARLAEGLDLLVTSGGASVGEHDLVASALGAAGLSLDFWKIAMRPGKPLLFGRLATTPVLGLPGNPVSTAVCSLVFLRAAIDRLLGRPDSALPTIDARLAAPLGANDGRQDFVRAAFDGWHEGAPIVRAAERQDSSMLATLTLADALIVRPPHDCARAQGALVSVVPLDRLAGV